MKLALPLLGSVLGSLLAAGCMQSYSGPGPGYDPGWTGPTGTPISGCERDTDCGSDICARDGACYQAANVHAVHVTWTMHGAPASDATCANSVNLYIQFQGNGGESFGYAPVPCHNGKYTIDKLPTLYTEVRLGLEGQNKPSAPITRTTSDVTLDLPY